MLRVFAVDQATGETERVNTWTDLSILELWNDKSGAIMSARDNGVHTSALWLEILHRPYGSILVTDEAGRSWSGRPFPTLAEQSDRSSGISFISDLTTLAHRVVTPRKDPTEWATVTHRAYSGPASTVLHSLIDDYCGPSATYPLDHFTLILPDPPTGPDIAIAARTGTVLDWVKLKATPAQHRVTAVWDQPSKKVVCRITECADRSNRIVFATKLMNETSWAQTITKPSYNMVIVAGQGEGLARTVVVRPTVAPSGPIIQAFFDQRNIDTLGELEKEADELLAAGAGSAQVTAVMVDTPEQAYGRDFFLGDLVKVVAAGAEYIEPVTAVATKATPAAVVRTVTAGFGPLNPHAQTKADLADLANKVSQIGAT